MQRVEKEKRDKSSYPEAPLAFLSFLISISPQRILRVHYAFLKFTQKTNGKPKLFQLVNHTVDLFHKIRFSVNGWRGYVLD